MSEQISRRLSYSLRPLLWLFVPVAALFGVYSCDVERLMFPITVFSKRSFTSKEKATLTSVLDIDLPPNARIDLASYNKHFGPGGGNITVRMQMSADEAAELRGLIVRRSAGYEHKPHNELSCPLPEWREANQNLEASFGLPTAFLYLSKPHDGQVSVYIEYEDNDSLCSRILSKGEKRTPLPRIPRP